MKPVVEMTRREYREHYRVSQDRRLEEKHFHVWSDVPCQPGKCRMES